MEIINLCIVEDSLFVLLSHIKKFVGRSWNYNFYLITSVLYINECLEQKRVKHNISLSFMKEEERQTYVKEPFLLQANKTQQDEFF